MISLRIIFTSRFKSSAREWGVKRDRGNGTVGVYLNHSAVEDNSYQYGHDFHTKAYKARFHDK